MNVSEKSPSQLTNYDILIVDDTPDNLRLLSALLLEKGFKVRKAINGERALQAVEASLPDLILLDVMMPDMQGYEVCRHLKESEKTRDIPIIFISALNDGFDKVLAFDVGGVDYITKPFHVPEVLARVDHQLNLRKQQQVLIEQNLKLQKALENHEKNQEILRVYLENLANHLRNPLLLISKILKNNIKTELSHQEHPENLTSIPIPFATLKKIINSCDQQVKVINSLLEITTKALEKKEKDSENSES